MNETTIEPVPLRALNQVSYCKRLYYLEYVDGVMPINEYVEDGLFHHRRVNDPGTASRTRKEGDVLRTRSVSFSSERLGITGTLDLLEEDGERIQPVEYKRSEAPRDAQGEPTWWENDAIQLCAQALLAEENLGVSIASGVLYYIGSKARVLVPIDQALRDSTLAAIALVRALSARDVPPEPLPLELRRRCFGCSLAPVCLPEETLYLSRHEPEPGVTDHAGGEIVASAPGAALVRVVAQNDDRAVLYLSEQGAHVGCRSAHLVATRHGETLARVPIASIR